MQSELLNVSFTHNGESKKSYNLHIILRSSKLEDRKSRWIKHKPGTSGNVGSAVKEHGDIHPNYTSILEKGAKSRDKRLFLESVDSFLDKNALNERAPFPRVDASLVASLRDDER